MNKAPSPHPSSLKGLLSKLKLITKSDTLEIPSGISLASYMRVLYQEIISDLIFKKKPDFNCCIILFTNQLFVKIRTVASSIDIGKKKSYMPS